MLPGGPAISCSRKSSGKRHWLRPRLTQTYVASLLMESGRYVSMATPLVYGQNRVDKWS